LAGRTNIKNGITSSTFSTVPDAPITSFELKLPTGRYSILGANLPSNHSNSFCGQRLQMPTVITAQNGAVIRRSTTIVVHGCPRHRHARRTPRHHRTRRTIRHLVARLDAFSYGSTPDARMIDSVLGSVAHTLAGALSFEPFPVAPGGGA
jgi:hypothetical protein